MWIKTEVLHILRDEFAEFLAQREQNELKLGSQKPESGVSRREGPPASAGGKRWCVPICRGASFQKGLLTWERGKQQPCNSMIVVPSIKKLKIPPSLGGTCLYLAVETTLKFHPGPYSSLHVLVIQSCPTLCDPTDCSPPDSSVHGILQARILEWVVISFSKGSPWPRDQPRVSCIAGRF